MGEMWIIIAIALVALLLIAFSRTMNILLGVVTTLLGVGAYIWFGNISSAEFQLELVMRFRLNPFELRNYTLILAGVGLVILIIGIVRGTRKHKVVFVQQQAPVQNVVHTQPVTAKVEEASKETELNKEVKKEETKKTETSDDKKEKEENKE